ncbi:MAG: amino acid adenylation domain-containing protein [Methylobacter sp.]|uniref:non-ribosomal peptide synthetase n=1 Tax=Methylobacter sp. TaxID=2051955 RepID=UPI0027321ED0|nr:non-ribosomal peptide synthetase [Methylobacter sp.]MDP1666746.1 amino acid adenylation domain-containing protein [Methylobacter sp.]
MKLFEDTSHSCVECSAEATDAATELFVFPMSFPQLRLWLQDKLAGSTGNYNIPCAFELQGRLDVTALEAALNAIILRHEALRTYFAERDGEPVQIIQSSLSIPLTIMDLRGYPEEQRTAESARIVQADQLTVFDLDKLPLLRAQLLRLEEEKYIFLLVFHHIIFDGWSMTVFARELSALYGAFIQERPSALPELPIQYADYAVWQREALQGEAIEQLLDYWKARLADAPTLELPTDKPRPAVQSYRGESQQFSLSPDLTEGLKALSQREGVTLFMTLVAAFQVLLHRYSGQDDIVLGTPSAGRNRLELEGLIGFFISTLVLRTDLSGDPSFRDLLKQVREVALGAYANQNMPFEKLVEVLHPQRDLSRNPLFQVMFILQNTPDYNLQLNEITEEYIQADNETAKFDLTLELTETLHGLTGRVEYATDLFEAATIGRLIGHFQTLLEGIVGQPETRLSGLPLLTDSERRQLLEEWKGPAVAVPERCIHQLFEEQAARSPEAVAVSYEDRQLTYDELNAHANQLAHHLRNIGVKPEVLVGICLERSLEMVIGLLGILKAGGAYVPLDPAYPGERLAFMLEDSAPLVLLTDGKYDALFADMPTCPPLINLSAKCPLWANLPETNPEHSKVGLTPENLAYVIYTSGSTGKPKGAGAVHQGLQNLFPWYSGEARLSCEDTVLVVSSIAFDLTQKVIFAPLLVGARVVLASEPFDPQAIVTLVAKEGISMMNLTPSGFHVLIDTDTNGELGGLRRVILGGEQMNPSKLLELPEPRPEFINIYGPTECTSSSTFYRLPPDLEQYRNRSVPIGRPIANARIYILDNRLQLVPIGVMGEIHIGGMPVGRGYLNRPELTAERFVRDPFIEETDAKMYKTGDLARWLADGTIEYLGRNDFQVKVRGFRIELGEIEAALRQHPLLREVVVGVYESAPGNKQLAAYLVPQSDSMPTPSELRDFLKPKLPEFMVPSAFVLLDKLPLTPSGKIDRKALPTPDHTRPEFEQSYVPPRSPIEEMLVAIWREVLNIDRIGIHDNFFELGGHSLLAVQLIVRVNKQFQTDFPMHLLFEAPTVAGVSKLLTTTLEQTPAANVEQIHTIVRDLPLPASYAQQRLWFLDRLLGASGLYNIPWAIQLNGSLNTSALQQSLNEIVARHEVLRTCFVEQDGELLQIIRASMPFECALVTLPTYPQENRDSEIQRLLHTESHKPFNLKETPLIRALLFKISEQEHILLVIIHHIVSDGWSMAVFRQELASLYCAFSQNKSAYLPELPVQYADYSVWQREWLQGEVLERQLSYWKTQLADLTVLELPTDKPRPKQPSYQGAQEVIQLSAALAQGLKDLSRQQNVTLFMTLLAAFQVLLHRYSGQEDIVVGTAIAGRNLQETENLIGSFVNTLALRTDVSGKPSFRQLLSRVREVCLSAYAHQDLPFEKLVAELPVQRDMSRNPLFQVMMVLQSTALQDMQLPGLTITDLTVTNETAKFDLTLSLVEHRDGLTGTIEYRTDLYNPETITRLGSHFQTLLEAIVEHPETAVAELPLLTAPERHQLLVEWNATRTDYPKDKCIHQLFEEQVAKIPDAIALVFEDQQLSYQVLNAKANQLAHYLQTVGVKPGTRVAICMDRSIDLVIGLLAILKAGGAYVPLDLTYPRDRLAFMLEDTNARVLLTHSSLVAQLPICSGRLVCLDTCWNDINQGSTDNLHCNTALNNPAYVMYTSGSTGVPKGVEVCHYNIARLILNNTYARFDDKQKFLLLASIAFDASTFEVWGALLHGARCVIYPERVPILSSLEKIIKQQQISILWLTASLFNTVIDEKPQILSTVAQVLTGGEALSISHINRALKQLPDTQLINGYGPTESTTFACCYPIPKTIADQATSIPIGYPIANTQIYILDALLQPVPIGVSGEIHVGGDGLALGYLNRPELTAEKFIKHPFNDDPHARLYKTGDLARYLPDGTIEFLGRIDHQVKIRGFRIELGEIESVLGQHPQLFEVVVEVYEPVPGNKRLVAYLVPQSTPAPLVSELRDFLKPKLPEFMIPSAFVCLDALPLTPNGKLDRKALPKPDQSQQELEADFIAPRNPVEKQLAEIWCNVLEIDRVGIRDNFFELGGHSLLVVKMVAEVNKLFNIDLPLGAIYQSPLVEELGIIISSGNRQPSWYSLVPIQTQGSRPPLFAIHTLSLVDLPRHLGKDQPLYFLRYGMAAEIGNRSLSLPLLEDLASHYIKELQQIQPHGPYYLIGFSFGGVIAYEMACQLVTNGHQVNLVGLMDTHLTHEKQWLPYHRVICNFFSLSPSQLLKKIKNKINDLGTSYKYGTDFWPHIYTSAPDNACHNNYQPKSYNGSHVTLFQGWESTSKFISYVRPEQAWKKLLGHKLEVQQVSGAHFDIFREPHVRILAKKLIACMDKVINDDDPLS